MRKRFLRLLVTLAAIGALAVGGSAVASATQSKPAKSHKPAAAHIKKAQAKTHTAKRSVTETPEPTSTESDGDAAAQDAACKAAGITSSNVNYDDATGTCTVDTGGND